MQNSNIRSRLAVMNFLEFAVWGAYLTSMGNFLAHRGLHDHIGLFYSVQGFVSIFMPALVGIVADRWIPAQRMLSLCHFLAALGMFVLGYFAHHEGSSFSTLFPIYAFSIALYMPTLALSNSVSYNALEGAGIDTVQAFPSIRIFGTVGFICSMWIVSLLNWGESANQFYLSGVWSLVLSAYALTLPHCKTSSSTAKKSLVDAFGLRAFKLFANRRMAIFFVFSMLLGMCLQVTNGYAEPFIRSFGEQPEYQGAFFVRYAGLLISLSQISETFCILLIPFVLRRFGIKTVMLIAMFAWVLRFGFFAFGSPVLPGLCFLVLSMLVYGVAFDFFNVSGSLFVDRETDTSVRSSAQGLFMLMTNGLGASIGTLLAQWVVNSYKTEVSTDWHSVWLIFSSFALVVALAFWLIFRETKKAADK